MWYSGSERRTKMYGVWIEDKETGEADWARDLDRHALFSESIKTAEYLAEMEIENDDEGVLNIKVFEVTVERGVEIITTVILETCDSVKVKVTKSALLSALQRIG